MKKLVFASNNAHKLEEVRAIMPDDITVLSLHDIGFEAEIKETGATLEQNSAIKAHAVYQWLKQTIANDQSIVAFGVFADDTGLEIDALHGAPGVYTARWAGEPAANRAKALRELADSSNRNAQFRTVITLIQNDTITQVEGIVRGEIAEKERGDGGFGYDPVFIPDGYNKTFAELPANIKNSISHRGRALAKLVQVLR